VLRDDTGNLLLTWVDTKGDYHVVQHPADVPLEGRDAVRAVVADRTEGTEDLFYVVDLRTKNGDGAYPVVSMSRGEWEAIAEKRRQKTLAAASPPPPSASASTGTPDQVQPSTKLSVIIYGASWCGACHDAAKHLRRRGVNVVEKDIEEDAQARSEMKAKLARAHMPDTGSIPVIDVRGRIIQGFNAKELDRAIASVTHGDEL
jgi:glutaredoxin